VGGLAGIRAAATASARRRRLQTLPSEMNCRESGSTLADPIYQHAVLRLRRSNGRTHFKMELRRGGQPLEEQYYEDDERSGRPNLPNFGEKVPRNLGVASTIKGTSSVVRA
jgi:hypothetical protein